MRVPSRGEAAIVSGWTSFPRREGAVGIWGWVVGTRSPTQPRKVAGPCWRMPLHRSHQRKVPSLYDMSSGSTAHYFVPSSIDADFWSWFLEWDNDHGPESISLFNPFKSSYNLIFQISSDQLFDTLPIHPCSAEEIVKMTVTKRSGADPKVVGCCGWSSLSVLSRNTRSLFAFFRELVIVVGMFSEWESLDHHYLNLEKKPLGARVGRRENEGSESFVKGISSITSREGWIWQMSNMSYDRSQGPLFSPVLSVKEFHKNIGSDNPFRCSYKTTDYKVLGQKTWIYRAEQSDLNCWFFGRLLFNQSNVSDLCIWIWNLEENDYNFAFFPIADKAINF